MNGWVVNIRSEKFDVYIGRKGHGYDGYFGNPFEIGRDGGRDAVIRKYKVWFWKRVNEDVEFRNRVMELKGKRLGCFCSPKRCHGEVIVSWLEAGCPLKKQVEDMSVSEIYEEWRKSK